MNLNSVNFIFKETIRNLWRNSWMALASVSTVAVSMFVLAFFVVLTININHVTSVLQNQVELRVFIKPGVTRLQEKTLLQHARQWPDVRKISFFTKQQAARQLQQEFPNQKNLLHIVTKANPLFDGFNVYSFKSNEIQTVARHFDKQSIVHNVVYQGRVVARLERISSVFRWVGWVVESLLALATLFIVVNTIRLAVYARRREIQIMKLVGASDWFIRWPFLLEGVILGVVGASLAQLAITSGYRWLSQAAAVAIPFWPLATSNSVTFQTAEFTLFGGLGVGLVASFVAIRKFLRT